MMMILRGGHSDQELDPSTTALFLPTGEDRRGVERRSDFRARDSESPQGASNGLVPVEEGDKRSLEGPIICFEHLHEVVEFVLAPGGERGTFARRSQRF